MCLVRLEAVSTISEAAPEAPEANTACKRLFVVPPRSAAVSISGLVVSRKNHVSPRMAYRRGYGLSTHGSFTEFKHVNEEGFE